MAIALIGDRDIEVVAHRAIEASLKRGSMPFEWLETDAIPGALAEYSGFWCVPGSPYRSEAGALRAIKYARENARPFLGTCGGFQHAVVEYARNVLNLAKAAHAEVSPHAALPVIAPLECSLVEQVEPVLAVPGTRFAALVGESERHEGYHCRFGLNPAFEHLFRDSALRICARDCRGEVRAMELSEQFFVLTLFQPERTALQGSLHPLVKAFFQASS